MDYLQYISFVICLSSAFLFLGFKPYYKWITFNTDNITINISNLSCSFKPYYKWITFNTIAMSFASCKLVKEVLNLIINGLPSIRLRGKLVGESLPCSFKPYYKWITFNTKWI